MQHHDHQPFLAFALFLGILALLWLLPRVERVLDRAGPSDAGHHGVERHTPRQGAQMSEGRAPSRLPPPPVDEGGSEVCWLDRVCPSCGRLDEKPEPVCSRCGTPRDHDADSGRPLRSPGH